MQFNSWWMTMQTVRWRQWKQQWLQWQEQQQLYQKKLDRTQSTLKITGTCLLSLSRHGRAKHCFILHFVQLKFCRSWRVTDASFFDNFPKNLRRHCPVLLPLVFHCCSSQCFSAACLAFGFIQGSELQQDLKHKPLMPDQVHTCLKEKTFQLANSPI